MNIAEKKSYRIGIVIPIYNEAETICELLEEIEKHVVDHEISLVVVNDGSADDSLARVRDYREHKATTHKRIINLNRNFGHQKALMAGLWGVSDDCDYVVVMDADFQDKPSDIPVLVNKLLDEKADCVYGVRTANSGSFMINTLTRIFYVIQSRLISFDIPMNAGTFCVFNRKMLSCLRQFKESEIYFPGLRAFVGLRQCGVQLTRGVRKEGKSRVGFKSLVNLSLSGITSFSHLPMRLIFMSGVLCLCCSVILSLVVLILKLTCITTIPGITTVLILILGGFGSQILICGIMGEYIGKLYLESKQRPNWLVDEVIDE